MLLLVEVSVVELLLLPNGKDSENDEGESLFMELLRWLWLLLMSDVVRFVVPAANIVMLLLSLLLFDVGVTWLVVCVISK